DFRKIAMLHVERISKAVESANKVVFTSIDFETLAQYYNQLFQKDNEILKAFKDNYHFDLVIHEKDLNPKSSRLEYFETITKEVEALLI
ncbi:MAG: hypothetical protein J6583_07390, partial [Gilliamella sp.]|nr:hypothetical protein [Gilliamella sp.]